MRSHGDDFDEGDVEVEVFRAASGDYCFVSAVPALERFGLRLDDVMAQYSRAVANEIPPPTHDQPTGLSGVVAAAVVRALRAFVWVLDRAPPPGESIVARTPQAGLVFCIGRRATPSPAQAASLKMILKNPDVIAARLQSAVYESFRNALKSDRDDSAEGPESLLTPAVVTGKELDDRFRVTSVDLHVARPRFLVNCECCWDLEHGIAVMFDQVQVVAVAELGELDWDAGT